nr:MAG TPA: hypothetical protein [Bacteriophage sp.]
MQECWIFVAKCWIFLQKKLDCTPSLRLAGSHCAIKALQATLLSII